MYTLYDYIKYYKNVRLEEVKWNYADNLICAMLSYLAINNFNESKSLKELYKEVIYPKRHYHKGSFAAIAENLLREIYDSKRYKNMLAFNFTNILNNDIQFGAVTFRLNNVTIVAYKGTDNSLIGWIENIRLGYVYPTNTQMQAIKYLNETIKIENDNKIYVVGHSKGGNLAMAATMECSKKIFDNIVNVVNFDGPGFRHEQFSSKKYKRMKDKLINFIPNYSIVGVLLENANYKVVKSKASIKNQHYPTYWLMYGEHFVRSKLSNKCLKFHQNMIFKIRKLDKNKVSNTFEVLYKNFGKEFTCNATFNFKEVFSFYKKFRNSDPKIKRNFEQILYLLFKRKSNERLLNK